MGGGPIICLWLRLYSIIGSNYHILYNKGAYQLSGCDSFRVQVAMTLLRTRSSFGNCPSRCLVPEIVFKQQVIRAELLRYFTEISVVPPQAWRALVYVYSTHTLPDNSLLIEPFNLHRPPGTNAYNKGCFCPLCCLLLLVRLKPDLFWAVLSFSIDH